MLSRDFPQKLPINESNYEKALRQRKCSRLTKKWANSVERDKFLKLVCFKRRKQEGRGQPLMFY